MRDVNTTLVEKCIGPPKFDCLLHARPQIGDLFIHNCECQVYFNQDMTLLERPPGRPEPGHFPWNAHYLYTLPFECPIPKVSIHLKFPHFFLFMSLFDKDKDRSHIQGCPTSYESPFGSIRYYVKATLIEEDENGQRGVTVSRV